MKLKEDFKAMKRWEKVIYTLVLITIFLLWLPVGLLFRLLDYGSEEHFNEALCRIWGID